VGLPAGSVAAGRGCSGAGVKAITSSLLIIIAAWLIAWWLDRFGRKY
jgi:hypothetical protein